MRTYGLFTKATARRFAVAACVSLCCASRGMAQGSEARVGPVKGAVIKGGQNAQLVFCVSSNAPASDYRLKVWQLMQGQSATAAMAANRIIATTTAHAINTKGAGSGDRLAAPANADLTASCAAALQAQASATIRTPTRSNQPGDRAPATTPTTEATIAAVIIENFPACARGRSCDYVWTIEPIALDRKTATVTYTTQAPHAFSIAADGTISSGNDGRQ